MSRKAHNVISVNIILEIINSGDEFVEDGRYHHGDLKNALIEEGLKVITKVGMDALSIRYVANKIGVSSAAPYRHFKNKEELIVAIAIHGFEILMKEIDEAMEKTPDDPADQLMGFAKALIAFAVSHPDYYRIMYRDYIKNKTEYPNLFQAFDISFQRLVDIIANCRKERRSGGGKASPSENVKGRKQSQAKAERLDAEITALAASSLLHGYSSMIIDNQKDATVGSKTQIELVTGKLLNLI